MYLKSNIQHPASKSIRIKLLLLFANSRTKAGSLGLASSVYSVIRILFSICGRLPSTIFILFCFTDYDFAVAMLISSILNVFSQFSTFASLTNRFDFLFFVLLLFIWIFWSFRLKLELKTNWINLFVYFVPIHRWQSNCVPLFSIDLWEIVKMIKFTHATIVWHWTGEEKKRTFH